MAKKVKNHNTGDSLWTKKEWEFIKDAVDLNLTPTIAAEYFNEEFPRDITISRMGRMMGLWRNFKGSWEEFVSSSLKLNGSNYNKWSPAEIQIALESVKKGLSRNEILSALEKKTGFWRSYPSLDNKLQRLQNNPKNKEYFTNWRTKTGREISEISSYPIHPDRKLKYIPKVIKKGIKYPLICNIGHEVMADPEAWHNRCTKCYPHTNGVFRHENPLEPGIFYYGPLLDSPLNDFKQGNTLERIGVEVRSKRYGNFEWKEVHKPIGEVEDFEELMKARFQEYRTDNPMLAGNGSTETFKLIVLSDLEKFVNIWTSKGLAGVKTVLATALKI